ncbi:MAG: hypothetical protein KGJ86_21875 [Chloroflexota bacterium]|nr:hypothetical protein [Chloroflexota bacterium]
MSQPTTSGPEDAVRHDAEQPGRIFLANVGVNASHRLTSPLRADGAFTLVTIPEAPGLDGPQLVRYGDVKHLREVVPERYWGAATHHDPEFESLTYGDNCARAARAAALKGCRPGDWIVFLARLVGEAGAVFALVGLLEVESILRDVRARPEPGAMARYSRNAHIRRALADERFWDGFWVFAGTPRSRMFTRAVVVGRPEAELLFRDRDGAAWNWRPGRSDLQTIGSYTRTCRCIIDGATAAERWCHFWQLVAPEVP